MGRFASEMDGVPWFDILDVVAARELADKEARQSATRSGKGRTIRHHVDDLED